MTEMNRMFNDPWISDQGDGTYISGYPPYRSHRKRKACIMRHSCCFKSLMLPRLKVTCRLDPSGLADGDTGGLLVFGYRYCYLSLRTQGNVHNKPLTLFLAKGDETGEEELWSVQLDRTGCIDLRVEVQSGAVCIYSYSLNGVDFTAIPVEPFEASEARWVGAKTGVFASGSGGGYIDIDWFRVTG